MHIEIPEIVGFPGFKSNEPLQLKAAGIPFKLYDPADYGIPGSFGVLLHQLHLPRKTSQSPPKTSCAPR